MVVDDVSQSEAPGSTSAGLLQGVQSHDARAWERLVRTYTPQVYSWCRSCSVSRDDVADVVQEVFRSVSTAVERFREDRGRFRGWLWTITQNKIRDHFRATTPAAQGGTDAQLRWLALPDEPASRGELTSDDRSRTQPLPMDVEVVRAQFEPRTWQAFWRTVVDEQPTKEVAEELGISVNAVRKAKSRVLHRLRQHFDGSESSVKSDPST